MDPEYSDPNVIIKIIAPDYASMDTTYYIGLAELQVAQYECGPCALLRPQMVANLAAHMITVATRSGGAVGDLESVKEGGAAIKYASSSYTSSIPGLSSTSYGQEYERLIRGCIFTPRTRNTDIYDYGCGCY